MHCDERKSNSWLEFVSDSEIHACIDPDPLILFSTILALIDLSARMKLPILQTILILVTVILILIGSRRPVRGISVALNAIQAIQ